MKAIATRSKDAGVTARNNKLLGAPGIGTRSKDATRLEAATNHS